MENVLGPLATGGLRLLWVTRMGDVVFGVPVGVVVGAALGLTAKVQMMPLVEAAIDAGVLVLIATW